MPIGEQVSTSSAVAEKDIKSFPAKCDHCDWTGTVGDARIVEGKAQCPKCGGSLAGNRPMDNVIDMFHGCLNLEDNDF